MLLPPEGNERRFDPVAQDAEAVDAGVAGGAEGNQEPGLMDSGSAVVDGEVLVRATGLAAAAVAGEHRLAVVGEAAAGMAS